MKKILFVIAFVGAFFAANAQFYVGGGVGLWNSNSVGNSTFTITLAPEVGYWVNETLAVGGVLNLTSAGNTTIRITPYVRYVVLGGDLVSVFVDGQLGIGEDYLRVGAAPGISLKVTEKLNVVSHLGFLGYQKDNQLVDGFGLRASGNDLTIGLYYSF